MDYSALDFLLILFLLLANGFFVAAEFALVKAKEIRIYQLIYDPHSTVARINQIMRNHLEAYLAACQLGITMASLGLGWVGEPAVSALIEPILQWFGLDEATLHIVSFFIGFLIFSALHIILGEQVPKTYAIRKPELVSLWIALPLQAFFMLAWPLNWMLNKASSLVLRVAGVKEVSYVEVMTGEELQNMIDISEEHGVLETNQATMLGNLFKFDSRSVEQLMIPRNQVHMLDLKQPPQHNIAILQNSRHSRLPLIDGDPDQLVGMVLAKDLFNALLCGDQPLNHLQDYSREPLIVPETLTVYRLFDQMRNHRTHMAFVKNEYGIFIGIITLDDVLEQIVGDIADETDSQETDYAPHALDDHTWEVNGLISLADLERHLDITIEDELDANTLSGLVALELQAIPREGDCIQYHDYAIRVLAVKDHRVERAELKKLGAKLPAAETPPL